MIAHSLDSLALAALAWGVAYLLHSSVLLVAAWLALAGGRVRSPVVREWVWKWAALAGVATSALAQAMPGPLAVTLDAATDVSKPPLAEMPPPKDDAASSAPGGPQPRLAARGESPPLPPGAPLVAAVPRPRAMPIDRLAASEEAGAPRPRATPIDRLAASETAAAPGPLPSSPLETQAAGQGVPSENLHPWAIPVGRGVLGWFIAATAYGLIGGVVSSKLLKRGLACRQVVADLRAAAALHSLCKAASLRRPIRLLACSGQVEPAAYGWRKPTIVLSNALVAQLTDAELRAVLAHELAHLVRRDTAWVWIGRLLCTTFAFQPGNRLARRRWRQAVEFRCDDWSLAQGIQRLSLASCLVAVAEWLGDRSTSVARLSATGSPLAARIDRLLNVPFPDGWNSPGRRRVLATVLIGSLLPGACWAPSVALSRPLRETAEAKAADAMHAATERERLAAMSEQLALVLRDVDRASELLGVRSADADLVQALMEIQVRCAQTRQRLVELQRRLSAEGPRTLP